MKATIFAIVAAASVAAAVPSAGTYKRGPSALRARVVPAVSIPPECIVCDGLGLACIAACLAGGPLDPACDICAAGSLDLIEQCIACIESN